MVLKIVSDKTEVPIADNIEIAKTFFQRLVGLLGRRTLPENYGLYFPRCRSIHSFFMKISIDILFLDQNLKITKIVNRLPPNRMVFSPFKTRDTLELSSGILGKYNLKVGDSIILVNTGNGEG